MNAKAKASAQALVVAHIDKGLREVQHKIRMNKVDIFTLVEQQKILKKERHELTKLLFALKPKPVKK